MKPIQDILEQRISSAIDRALAQLSEETRANLPEHCPAVVRPTQNDRFGDYQANGIMGLAKRLKQNPRQLATTVLEQLDLSDLCHTVEIAGPGFINCHLNDTWLTRQLTGTLTETDRLGIDIAEQPPKTIVDFSGPNIAKQMHVGHLRSTIIGDTISRIIAFAYGQPTPTNDPQPDPTQYGNDPAQLVVRQNHLGDWGLQMGMVIEAMKTRNDAAAFTIDELEALYKQINARCQDDPATAEACRQNVVRLQGGDPATHALWQQARTVSLAACQGIYDQLQVNLKDYHARGESFYSHATDEQGRNRLDAVIEDLAAADMLEESDGAQCVFLEGFKTREGEPLPLIVRKSNGAYLYATTDLAALRYRIDTLGARRIIYVTDSRQRLHFEMIFACARKAGWAGPDVTLEHVPFGSVLGEDGKPFKTRSGENVKLKDLLDEATRRAHDVVNTKNPELAETEKQAIAKAVGIGAVKYADLSNNLTSDYVFSWNRMLALEGNTAPYLQYAYARIRSIFRKGQIDESQLTARLETITITAPAERALVKKLLQYGETIQAVTRELRPHLLTTYLFELAQSFTTFYTECPVLKADGETRSTRLALALHTARTLQHGLELLGINTPQKM